MGKFASPAKQATAAISKIHQAGKIRSVGTARNYRQALVGAARFARSERINGGLYALTRADAIRYLELRGQEVGQKALDLDRQSLQSLLRTTGQLDAQGKLPVLKSELAQALTSRAYTRDQVRLVAQAQQARNALSTELAHSAGLRAHELLTLRRLDERRPHDRPARSEKFSGRQDTVRYSVTGKGGLIREVRIPAPLAARLEAQRMSAPRIVTDRGVHYRQLYDIAGGHSWSQSFSSASKRALGWSEGAHGVRHSYAQQRMNEIQSLGLARDDALEIVSQEMGHFRASITEVYLR